MDYYAWNFRSVGLDGDTRSLPSDGYLLSEVVAKAPDAPRRCVLSPCGYHHIMREVYDVAGWARLLARGRPLSSMEHLSSVMRANMGDLTFQEVKQVRRAESRGSSQLLRNSFAPALDRRPRPATSPCARPRHSPRPQAHSSAGILPCSRPAPHAHPHAHARHRTRLHRELPRLSRRAMLRFAARQAFDKTGRILNIPVSPYNTSEPPRLLNYLTAPHVVVWSAAVASSAVPGIFRSVCVFVCRSVHVCVVSSRAQIECHRRGSIRPGDGRRRKREKRAPSTTTRSHSHRSAPPPPLIVTMRSIYL